MGLHQDITALINVIIGAIVAIGGLWLNVAKNHREAKRERREANLENAKILEKIDLLFEEVKHIKEQNEEQQEMIEVNKKISHSQFRMILYSNLIVAIKRGYTTVSEATEINKMYAIYRENGGNGEIQLLFVRFDKLSIKEDFVDETN